MRQSAHTADPAGRVTTRQASVAEMQARIAALEAELLVARDREAATGEILEVINASPGDLAPVFEAVLDKAMTLCGAAFGILLTYDGKAFRTGATRGLPPRYAEYLATTSDQPGSGAASPRLARGEPLIHIVDIRDSELYRAGDPYRRALSDIGGARLALPLRREDAMLGTINFYRQEVRPFTDDQIALLQNFAAQAVIAMENARLLTETREALDRQPATAEVLQVINSSPGDLAPVFDAMLEKAMQLCEGAFGGLWVFEGDRYLAAALRGVPAAYAQFLSGATMLPGEGSAPDRFRRGERSVIQNIDLKAEELYQVGDPQRRALVDLGGARTAMQVPL